LSHKRVSASTRVALTNKLSDFLAFPADLPELFSADFLLLYTDIGNAGIWR
jgi:hypothetical protein